MFCFFFYCTNVFLFLCFILMIFSMITIIDVHAFCLCLPIAIIFILFLCLIMGNDIVAYRIAIGSFYLRTRSVVVKNILVPLKLSSYVLLVLLLVINRLSLINYQSFINNYLFGCFYQNISFTLLLLQLCFRAMM